ncbi:hypothetical protein BASA50_007015 [Batrachochytrium salamandrivorans]|uniref:Uncharacterized protein n=1 Tax=Batrachochytrium salamandrivorans TaxID=1357716 RepID=A0ABQ8FB65_9FUNG|nr:hypothetical protein BASA50_007015 [Batrachochytrium salamandrivorans]
MDCCIDTENRLAVTLSNIVFRQAGNYFMKVSMSAATGETTQPQMVYTTDVSSKTRFPKYPNQIFLFDISSAIGQCGAEDKIILGNKLLSSSTSQESRSNKPRGGSVVSTTVSSDLQPCPRLTITAWQVVRRTTSITTHGMGGDTQSTLCGSVTLCLDTAWPKLSSGRQSIIEVELLPDPSDREKSKNGAHRRHSTSTHHATATLSVLIDLTHPPKGHASLMTQPNGEGIHRGKETTHERRRSGVGLSKSVMASPRTCGIASFNTQPRQQEPTYRNPLRSQSTTEDKEPVRSTQPRECNHHVLLIETLIRDLQERAEAVQKLGRDVIKLRKTNTKQADTIHGLHRRLENAELDTVRCLRTVDLELVSDDELRLDRAQRVIDENKAMSKTIQIHRKTDAEHLVQQGKYTELRQAHLAQQAYLLKLQQDIRSSTEYINTIKSQEQVIEKLETLLNRTDNGSNSKVNTTPVVLEGRADTMNELDPPAVVNDSQHSGEAKKLIPEIDGASSQELIHAEKIKDRRTSLEERAGHYLPYTNLPPIEPTPLPKKKVPMFMSYISTGLR